MLQENTIEVSGAPTWGSANDWRVVDGALRAIARRRAGLDAEEARWLREAEAMQIWRPLGMVNALDYLERVLGYAPRAGQERLRVARALGDLPVLERALAESELAYSAVRELSRVATRATEAAWARAAAGKNLRQIEELVAGHAPGGFPDDPPDPEVRTRVVRFELSPETFARLRQVQAALDDKHGAKMTDDELVADTPERATQDVPPATVRFVLRRDGRPLPRARLPLGARPRGPPHHPPRRRRRARACEPRHPVLGVPPGASRRPPPDQRHRRRARGRAAGRSIDPRPHGRARALRRLIIHGCPRGHAPAPCGSDPRVDDDGLEARGRTARGGRNLRGARTRRATRPARVRIPPPLPALTSLRSRTSPPPRSGSGEPHPELTREHGAGRATALPRPRGRARATPRPFPLHAHVGANPHRRDAILALTTMGWKPSVAQRAVDKAYVALAPEAPLERLVFESLRRCPH